MHVSVAESRTHTYGFPRMGVSFGHEEWMHQDGMALDQDVFCVFARPFGSFGVLFHGAAYMRYHHTTTRRMGWMGRMDATD
jgi:hypothetical protein